MVHRLFSPIALVKLLESFPKLNRRDTIFAWAFAISVNVMVMCAVILYDGLLGTDPAPQWKQKAWIADAAKRQPMPLGSKAWQFGVYDLKPNGDGMYHAGGVTLITYHDKESEQRHWQGVAEIHTNHATLRTFELGAIATARPGSE
jgi:hypothetical protein